MKAEISLQEEYYTCMGNDNDADDVFHVIEGYAKFSKIRQWIWTKTTNQERKLQRNNGGHQKQVNTEVLVGGNRC